jgi:lysophospholipid acyltransferase (LPLAT)-like uncharacterized protein
LPWKSLSAKKRFPQAPNRICSNPKIKILAGGRLILHPYNLKKCDQYHIPQPFSKTKVTKTGHRFKVVRDDCCMLFKAEGDLADQHPQRIDFISLPHLA